MSRRFKPEILGAEDVVVLCAAIVESSDAPSPAVASSAVASPAAASPAACFVIEQSRPIKQCERESENQHENIS